MSITLSSFIASEAEPILQDWEKFARSVTLELPLTKERLRDHAALILRAVVSDMETAQSLEEQADKSKGLAPEGAPPLTNAAESHAVGRMADQFSLNDLVAEFRALRASVLRRWAATAPEGPHRVEEVTRFNEAIDQALAVSMAHYHAKMEEARTVILGILAHDLRTPLQAISLGSEFILRSTDVPPRCVMAATRTLNSVSRMKGLVQDLLDYTLTSLGTGLPVDRQPIDLAIVVRDVAEEAEASHPGRAVVCEIAGKCMGLYDGARIAQMLTNLLANALEHGDASGPVQVQLKESGGGVALTVVNQGSPIPEELRAGLFIPLKQVQRRSAKSSTGSSGLGLGLYVASEIALAHQGRLELVSSDKQGTSFGVFLPSQRR